MLRTKFRSMDNATIDDSIQYAKIEYWRKKIYLSILDENEAFAWFVKVAQRYLIREIRRLNRQCNILNASKKSDGNDPEKLCIFTEMLDALSEKPIEKSKSILLKRAIGYSLKELARSERISVDALRQRYSRERRLAMQKTEFLFH